MVAFLTKSSMCFTFPIVAAGSRAGSIAKIFVVGGDCIVADVEVTDNVIGFVFFRNRAVGSQPGCLVHCFIA